jgi:hypothetical protein
MQSKAIVHFRRLLLALAVTLACASVNANAVTVPRIGSYSYSYYDYQTISSVAQVGWLPGVDWYTGTRVGGITKACWSSQSLKAITAPQR